MENIEHTCIDELIDVLDDVRWNEAMESKKTCPACIERDRESMTAQAVACGIGLLWELAEKLEANAKKNK